LNSIVCSVCKGFPEGATETCVLETETEEKATRSARGRVVDYSVVGKRKTERSGGRRRKTRRGKRKEKTRSKGKEREQQQKKENKRKREKK